LGVNITLKIIVAMVGNQLEIGIVQIGHNSLNRIRDITNMVNQF
jgi:hypothetical protein